MSAPFKPGEDRSGGSGIISAGKVEGIFNNSSLLNWGAKASMRSTSDISLIRRHLAALTAHPLFTQAERLARFLSYIVDAELNGETDKLNQNTLAIDVFGRGADFDPTADSIVRVEAGRLRAKLREYYEIVDTDDGIRIELPKGSYVPLFHVDSNDGAATDPLTTHPPPSSDKLKPLLVVIGVVVLTLLLYLFLKPGEAPLTSTPTVTTTAVPATKDETGPVSVVLNKTPSIAVLPFVNMSGDPEQEYFSDGIAEEILNALAQLPELRVAARTSSFYFKGKDIDLDTISEKLKVNHVLEGSVRRSVDRLRITAKLIDATNGFQLWSESFDREIEDVFIIQEEIALAIVNALRLQLDENSHQLVTIGTRNLSAYNFFLQGKAPVIGATSGGINRSIKLFEAAIKADPNFADAYAYLSYAHISRHPFTRYSTIAPAIKASYKNALALDPNLSSALCSKAYDVIFSDWDWVAAEQIFEKAIKPGTVEAPCTDIYSFWYLTALNRVEDALEYLINIEKLDPLNITIKWALGSATNMAGDYDLAQEMLVSVLDAAPDNVTGLYDAATSLLTTGVIEEAEKIIRRLESLDEPAAQQFAINQRIQLEVLRRNIALAESVFNKALKDAETRSNPSPGLWNQLAFSAVILGELDQAIKLFERAFSEGAPGTAMARASLTRLPSYQENGKKLMARTEFQNFLAKMNMDDESMKKYRESNYDN